jgi:protease-4
MLSYPLYFIRYFFWLLGKWRRRFGKDPQTIQLNLEEDYPQIPVPPSNIFIAYFRPPKTSLLQLGEQFRLIAADPRVQTVVLHIRPLSMSLAKIDVLRGYIQHLRDAGKRVVTWSYHYGLGSFYLACAADEIILLPGGDMGALAISREYFFLADALEQIGVQADFVQVSPYKSAGDMFTHAEMSQEVKEMGNWLSDSTWRGIVSAVAAGRGMSAEQVHNILDETPCSDLDAKEYGFIDAILNEDQLPVHLGSEAEPAQLIQWKAALRQVQQNPPRKPGKYVALMGIEGLIIDGNSAQPPLEPPIPVPFGIERRAGSRSITQLARQVQADDRAAALVVYVDSTGGSPTASESISAALAQVADRKPLVVAMGTVAASGGYYVATPGQVIFAQPNTITGSIGVIIGKFAFDGLLKKFFVHMERIYRGEAAHFYDPLNRWDEVQRDKIQRNLNRLYDLFLQRVSDSRGLAVEAVDAVGGGRVWTGKQALDHQLLDSLGGLDQAIDKARELAGLPAEADVRLFTQEKGDLLPVAEPAAWLRYMTENLTILSNRAMLLMPWIIQ